MELDAFDRMGAVAEAHDDAVVGLRRDLERVRDKATFEDPQQFSDGTVYVLVNGSFALRDGEATGVLAGVALLRGGTVFTGAPSPAPE